MTCKSTIFIPTGTSFYYLLCLVLFGLLSLNGFAQTRNEWRLAWDATDYNWSTPTNWSQGRVPTSTDNVIVGYPGEGKYPVIDGINAFANSITLGYNYTLIIQGGSELTVTNDFNTFSNITIIDSKLTIIDGNFIGGQSGSENAIVTVTNGVISANNFSCGALVATYTDVAYLPEEDYLITLANFSAPYTYNTAATEVMQFENARVRTNNILAYSIDAKDSNLYIDGSFQGEGTVTLDNCIVHTGKWISSSIIAIDSEITGNSDFEVDERNSYDNLFINTRLELKDENGPNGTITLAEGGIIENSYFSAVNLDFSNEGANSLYIKNSTIEIQKHIDNRVNDMIFEEGTYVECETMTNHNDGAGFIGILTESVVIVDKTLYNQTKLYIDSGSSLIQIDETDTNDYMNTNSDTFVIDREVLINDATDYVYWASPTYFIAEEATYNSAIATSVNISTIGDGANTQSRFQWLPTIDNDGTYASNLGNWERYNSGSMIAGQGYAVKGYSTASGNSTQAFIGNRPYNGTLTVTLQEGGYTGNEYAEGPSNTGDPNEGDKLNLLGNPYPSAISIEKFLIANQDVIEGGIRRWTHGTPLGTFEDPFFEHFEQNYTSADYIVTTATGSNVPGPTGFIASTQGFLVKAKLGTNRQNATFTNDMRQLETNYTNDNFYKQDDSPQNSRLWLTIVADASKHANSTLLGYINGVTEANDALYNSHVTEFNAFSIYTLSDNEPLVIQAKGLPFINTDVTPLGMYITTKDLYTISLSDMDGIFLNGQDIYIEDTYENVIHNLQESSYQFASEKGKFNDRFVIRYTSETLNIDDVVSNSDFKIIATQDFIKVSTTTNTINNVVIYDVLGRVLYQATKLYSSEVRLDQIKPTNGLLVIKATLTNGTEKSQKIIF